MKFFYLISPKKSERLQYVLDVAFEQLWGIQVQVIQHLSEAQENTPILAYHSNAQVFSIPTIPDAGILWQKETKVSDWAAQKDKLFSCSNTSFVLDFDVFSAIFSVLTQLWLYETHETDLHDRPNNKQNPISYDECWVPIWSLGIIQMLGLQPQKQRKIQVQLSIDVDNPFYFLHRSVWDQGLSLANSLRKLQINQAIEKWMMAVKGKDPFQTYTLLAEKFYGKDVIWFFLTKYGNLNSNTPWDASWASPVCSILKEAGHQIGLHPSYETLNDPELIFTEKNTLEAILKQPVQAARQHYLRTSFDIRKQYLKLGILHDYSLALSNQNGFIGGMPEPFLWFDPETNQVSNLTLHPAVVMDRSLLSYQKLNPTEAVQVLYQMYAKQLHWGGTFCLLAHNETFSNFGEWQDWSQMLFEFLEDTDF